MMDDHDLTPAEEQLLTTLAAEGEAVTQHAAEGNLHTAMEHLHVALMLARMGLAFERGGLSTDHLEVMERVAWAQAELLGGYGYRVLDDLDGVESAAEELR